MSLKKKKDALTKKMKKQDQRCCGQPSVSQRSQPTNHQPKPTAEILTDVTLPNPKKENMQKNGSTSLWQTNLSHCPFLVLSSEGLPTFRLRGGHFGLRELPGDHRAPRREGGSGGGVWGKTGGFKEKVGK